MKNRLLYIGLNGFAGSGKDTVAKALRIMLNTNWESFEQFKAYYDEYQGYGYANNMQFATFNKNEGEKYCMCIAFADQLKLICADMFGIPVDRFYYNKANSWICINKDFTYTESKPDDKFIISAEDYYTGFSNYNNSHDKYYISLREILVYVGTYVLQQSINKNIFVNIVNNTINRHIANNSDLKYVICTDVRFTHELDYIKNHNGVAINITRNNVIQLDNIAEHDLDENDDYDFVIENNGTYEDLFHQVWDMVHTNDEFKNEITEIYTRDNTDNYLRLVETGDDCNVYKLCTELSMLSEKRENGKISFIDPVGGPVIALGCKIDGTNLVPQKIELNEYGVGFLIYAKKLTNINF